MQNHLHNDILKMDSRKGFGMDSYKLNLIRRCIIIIHPRNQKY